MTEPFERLQRVLELEKQQGYKNKAVVGGIRQFAAYWVGQARAETIDEADHFFVDMVADILANYHRLPGDAARRDTVSNLLGKLRTRQARVDELAARNSQTEVEENPAVPFPSKPTQKSKSPVAAEPLQSKMESPQREKSTAKQRRQPAEVSAESQPVTEEKPAAKREAPVQPDPVGLAQPVTVLKGVGPKIASLLAKVGAETVQDMLYLHPRRYDDYSQMKPIGKLEFGESVTVVGTIWQVRVRKTRTNQYIVNAVLGDGTGKIQLNFYGQRWLVGKLKGGMQVAVSGKVEQYLGRPVFTNPEWEQVGEEQLKTNRIVPIYPLTKGLGATKMRSIMYDTVAVWTARIADPLPKSIRNKHKLFSLRDALRHVHFPRNAEMLRKAQERLAFDEAFLLQLGMLHQRREWQRQPARPLNTHEGERIRFYNSLPFDPTKAQKRVIGEISADISNPVPMNRLLQGDVGAGKTIVAAAAIVTAVKAGVQAALMAPTEILAEQHFKGLTKLLEPLGIRVRLLTSGVPAKEKKQIYMEAAQGQADLFIGTTALIQQGIDYQDLGLVVIDEQHRFGVDQRGMLRDKGKGEFHPHLLVMTATPIPRSLALSVYGDLDLSILDEMPPGRQEILTRWLKQAERERAYGFIRSQVAEGRQAYMIFPLVEESEKLDDVKAATVEYERLQQDIFPNLRLGLLHGRMNSAEKETAMRQFYAQETDVLISTTVVEVGVDVPNATVMVIEGANRFGLAQLHQLRGRVGRGAHKSYCILISDSTSSDAIERLTALEDTNDGFVLAEKDLELRGPGEFFGRRQSGMPELQMALLFDQTLLQMARDEAIALVEQDAELEADELSSLRERVKQFWQNAGDVS